MDEKRGLSHNNALTLRHGGQEQEVCVPWVAGRTCFGAVAGQPHPFTGSEAPPRRQALQVRLSGVVSAEPLDDRWRRLIYTTNVIFILHISELREAEYIYIPRR